ncbi:MAG TPA: hypothetical protein VGF82_02725 [Terracidiphilus sp.]
MKTLPRLLAALELMLIFPAVLFMSALFARSIQSVALEPAHTAQRIVDWYASSPHIGLWLLLIAFPFAVVATGIATLSRQWRRDPDLRDATAKLLALIRSQAATLLIAAATSISVAILAIVAVHVLTD